MPLVRYRTGDLGRMIAEPCACGCLKLRLDKVEGRLDDSVRLPDGRILSMHVLDELLFSLDEVEDFQASYNAAQKHLTVAVMKKAAYADADLEPDSEQNKTMQESSALQAEKQRAETKAEGQTNDKGDTDGKTENMEKNRMEKVEMVLTEYFGNSLTVSVVEKEISPYIGSGKRRLIIEKK